MASDEQRSESKPAEVPWTQPNGIYATYDLHCHCGAIRYIMKISPPLYEEHAEGKEQCVAVECNCSYCERNGSLSVHPLAKDVEFTQGLEDRVNYYSGIKQNPHWFCRHCASVIGIDLTSLMEQMDGMETRYTINVCTKTSIWYRCVLIIAGTNAEGP